MAGETHGKMVVLWDFMVVFCWLYGGFRGFYGIYPIVNVCKLWKTTMFNGKTDEISMAGFNSYVSHYQRVDDGVDDGRCFKFSSIWLTSSLIFFGDVGCFWIIYDNNLCMFIAGL